MSPELFPNDLFAMEQLGPYLLKDVLGRGGMGTVYRAHDTLHDRDVAVKVVAPSFAAIEGFRDRFQSEIHSLEKLRHPNIVELYGYGEENEHLFYAMELVTGGNLQQELSAGCRFSWRDVIRYGVDICGALRHAHDCGIIHRDIKPANLLLDQDGNLKLSDFGIAKLFGETQRTLAGSIVGTADYMSPEQAEGLSVTPRSDLYSLGCVMYALLTGGPPFRGKSVPEVIHKVRFEPPPPIHRQGVELPGPLEAVVHQLLAKDPEQRIPTPLALAKRLQAIEQDCSLPDSHSSVTMIVDNPTTHADQRTDTRRDGPHSTDSTTPPRVDMADTLDAVDPLAMATHHGTPNESNAPAAPVRQFTLVDDAYRRQLMAEPSESHWKSLARVVTALAALALLMYGGWQLIRPSTADELFARIETSQRSGIETVIVDSQRRRFLQRFPDDPRAEDVRQWEENTMLDRLERNLMSRDRSETHADWVIEDWLRQSLRLQEADPQRSAEQLEAIVTLYGDTKSLSNLQRRHLLLAQRSLERIRTAMDQKTERHKARVELWLEEAREVTGARRQAICESILRLYADQDWARPYLAEAHALLADPTRVGTVE